MVRIGFSLPAGKRLLRNLISLTKRIEFKSREDAKQWIILNQFGRRNLSAYDRSLLALKLKPLIAEKAKAKQSEAGGAVRQKSDKAVIDTKKELAKIAGVSHDTIIKELPIPAALFFRLSRITE